jgi:hypothetical protein
MKTRHDSLGTAENYSERAKHEKQVPTPSITPKMTPAAQNMNMGTNALRTA